MQLNLRMRMGTRPDSRVSGLDRLFRTTGSELLLLALAALIGSGGVAYGHDPQPTSGEPSAKSFLETTNGVNGRIGGYSYRGSLTPTPGAGSRFSNDAVYGSAGNIVGVTPRSNGSRFQGGSSAFKSKQDFSALSMRNEYRKLQAAANPQKGVALQTDNSPRLVTAQPAPKIPVGAGRTPRYGKTREEIAAILLAQQEAAVLAAQTGNPGHEAQDQNLPVSGDPQRIWMRGRAPLSGVGAVGFDQGLQSAGNPVLDGFFDYTQYGADGYAGSGYGFDPGYSLPVDPLGGALSLAPDQIVEQPPVVPQLTQEQVNEAFREYLEAQLLRSPDVSPLSPIQVTFQDGVATVRGVVPTPSARTAAGKILLADPRIERVNNMLTSVRPDDAETGVSTQAGAVPNAPSSAGAKQ